VADNLFDGTISGLNTALNFHQMNQSVISSNIANADTPGYHSQKLEFESALKEAMQLDDYMAMEADGPDHYRKTQPGSVMAEIYENPNGVVNEDGNSVDRNAESVNLAANQIQYDAGAEMLKRKLAMLKYAITEGSSR
jgi:flagellar basal-body rod protein FlgB